MARSSSDAPAKAPKEPGRIRQMVQVFRMTIREDPPSLWIMLGVFIIPVLLGVAIGLLLWGGAAFAIVPPVQMRVMEAASEAPGLASSINVGAFNLGNALGAAVGAAVISLNLGYAAEPVAGGLLAAVGLGLVLLAARRP